jgi:outer membrane protein assembly factor BamB
VINGKVFLATIAGEVMCLSAATCERPWSVKLGGPMLFQPAVSAGRVYVATYAGSLFCLEIGDPDDQVADAGRRPGPQRQAGVTGAGRGPADGAGVV